MQISGGGRCQVFIMNFCQFNMNFCGEARRFAPEATSGSELPPNLLGIAVPYGIYDLQADAGTVFVSAGVLRRGDS